MQRAQTQRWTAAEVMTRDVISISPTALIEQAIDVMLARHVSGLAVVDRNGQLVGVISEYDALRLMLENQTWCIAPVAHYMSTEIVSVPQDASLDVVAQIFRSTGVRRLPVVRDGRMVGIISRRDLMRAIRQRREVQTDELLACEAAI
jgi:CBS domain-containing protein